MDELASWRPNWGEADAAGDDAGKVGDVEPDVERDERECTQAVSAAGEAAYIGWDRWCCPGWSDSVLASLWPAARGAAGGDADGAGEAWRGCGVGHRGAPWSRRTVRSLWYCSCCWSNNVGVVVHDGDSARDSDFGFTPEAVVGSLEATMKEAVAEVLGPSPRRCPQERGNRDGVRSIHSI